MKIKVLVRQWMTKYGDNKIPMRTMVGIIEKESPKAYKVKLHGSPEPSSKCLHCNKKITNKISQYIGLGPICGQHFYISPVSEEKLDEFIEDAKKKLAEVTWEGWIPKSQIVELTKLEEEVLEEPEVRYQVAFKYDGKTYRSNVNSENLLKIRLNSEILELEQVI